MVDLPGLEGLTDDERRLLVGALLFCTHGVFSVERRDGAASALWEPAHGLERRGLLEWRACGATACAGRRSLRVQYSLTVAGEAAARALLD